MSLKKCAAVVFAAAFLLLCLLSLCSCGIASQGDSDTLNFENENIGDNMNDDANFLFASFEIRGVWFSYLELKAAPKSSEEEFSSYLEAEFKKYKDLGLNSVFLQVRPFADSIFESELFPSSSCVVKKQGEKLPFDFLSVAVECAEKNGLSLHAWINPYRILPKGGEMSSLSETSPGKTFKEPDIVSLPEGVFFSPASLKAQKLIISGVKEILEKYGVDGIHIDDYFYPSTEKEVDEKQYEEYKKSGGALPLADWRRENVNALVRGIYGAVKACPTKKIFSISPGGDIEKNRNIYFADVKKWGSEEGYCDVLMPQIYYGFKNESKPFEKCAEDWRALVKSKTVKLSAGLALYKVGKEDTFAGESGKNEWKNEEEIISRQVEFLKDKKFDGFCLYSAQFVNFNENLLSNELKSLESVL